MAYQQQDGKTQTLIDSFDGNDVLREIHSKDRNVLTLAPTDPVSVEA